MVYLQFLILCYSPGTILLMSGPKAVLFSSGCYVACSLLRECAASVLFIERHTTADKHKQREAPTTVNYRFLIRLYNVHSQQRVTTQKLNWLQTKIAKSVKKIGVDVNEDLHKDI